MKRNIIAFCIFCLCTGSLAACNDFDNPAIPDDEAPEVTPAPVPPAIDPSWNLVQMPDEGGQNPRVFVYKDKKYDALFTRTLGWNGGDGVLTTALPGGHVFWSFNDSFYGVVDGKTRARGSCSFPRNSLMIQKGATIASGQESDDDLVWLADYVQTDNPSGERYYQARTHIRHPKASLSDAEIQKGEIDQDYCYWAGDAVVYDDPAHGKILQMLWTGVEPGSLKNIDGCLREYSLEGEPGDGQYMSVLSTDYNFKSDGLGYGSTMFEDTEGGHIYLYTTKQVNLVSRVLVARTETLDLGSPWSYYIRDLSGDYHWQSSVPSNEEMERSYITAESGSMPWVFEKTASTTCAWRPSPSAATSTSSAARRLTAPSPTGRCSSRCLRRSTSWAVPTTSAVHDQPPPGAFAPGRAGILDQQRPGQLLGQFQPRRQRRFLPALLLPRI